MNTPSHIVNAVPSPEFGISFIKSGLSSILNDPSSKLSLNTIILQ